MSSEKRKDMYEVYVTGYSKNRVEKDDLYDAFKHIGKIKEISYKGPFSFIAFET